MPTAAGKSLDELNDAFNALHKDVCAAGRSSAGLCSDVVRARDEWRLEWQSWHGVSMPVELFDKWIPVYQELRTRAVADKVRLSAPKGIVSPVERFQAGVKAAEKKIADVGAGAGRIATLVVVVAVLAWVASRQPTGRSYG